jgi:hypothetical protein
VKPDVNDTSAIQDHDVIGVENGLQPVSDYEEIKLSSRRRFR